MEKDIINVEKEYPNIFTGRGYLGNEYKIILDENVPPVINGPRRVPFTLMKPLKEKLDELVKKGLIK